MNESEERQTTSQEKKARIRERYKGINPNELDIIPAIQPADFYSDKSTKRVAVYARVSTDDPNQTSSYELQKNHYTDVVSRHEGWELSEIYADEGISGTSLQVLALTMAFDNKNNSFFKNNYDVYRLAPIVGFLYQRKADVDPGNITTKIFGHADVGCKSTIIKNISKDLMMQEELVKNIFLITSPIESLEEMTDNGFEVEDYTINIERELEKKIDYERLMECINNLPDRQKDVILYRYGFYNGKEYTLNEIGQIYKITRERVRQIEAKALERIESFCRDILVQYYLKS